MIIYLTVKRISEGIKHASLSILELNELSVTVHLISHLAMLISPPLKAMKNSLMKIAPSTMRYA